MVGKHDKHLKIIVWWGTSIDTQTLTHCITMCSLTHTYLFTITCLHISLCLHTHMLYTHHCAFTFMLHSHTYTQSPTVIHSHIWTLVPSHVCILTLTSHTEPHTHVHMCMHIWIQILTPYTHALMFMYEHTFWHTYMLTVHNHGCTHSHIHAHAWAHIYAPHSQVPHTLMHTCRLLHILQCSHLHTAYSYSCCAPVDTHMAYAQTALPSHSRQAA